MHMQIESINIEKIIEDTWESNKHNFYFMTILWVIIKANVCNTVSF